MKNGDWFDAAYFGHKEGERKSNYPAVGGYKDNTGAPELFARWVLRQAELRGLHNPTVLEVGCATGAAVRAFRDLDVEAWGVDISDYIYAQAGDDVKPYLYVGDMRALGESSLVQHAPFDVVCSKDVLEHVTEDMIDDVLTGMARLCTFQVHIVNTGEFPYQAAEGDASHFLIRPLDWWIAKGEELGIDVLWKRT